MAGVRFDKIFKDKSQEISTNLVSGASLIQSELTFLLEMEKHTMFFGNDLGVDLNRYLYLLNNQATFNLIKDELENLFIKYKKAFLNKIDMTFDNLTKTLLINLEVTTNSRGGDVVEIPLTLGG